MIEVRTQKELDEALARTSNGADERIVCLGGGRFVLLDSSSAVLLGSSSARAFGRGKIKAGKYAVVMQHNPEAQVTGGRVLEMPKPATPEEWCEFWGVEVKDGIATLYKAVGENYATRNGVHYTPGTEPSAPDWDGGKEECGGGLHFSPHPKLARDFNRSPAHYVACPVALSEIVVHPDGTYPQKVKAPRVAGPCYEVWRRQYDLLLARACKTAARAERAEAERDPSVLAQLHRAQEARDVAIRERDQQERFKFKANLRANAAESQLAAVREWATAPGGIRHLFASGGGMDDAAFCELGYSLLDELDRLLDSPPSEEAR